MHSLFYVKCDKTALVRSCYWTVFSRYKQIVERFTNLLKVQVGALSRFVHSQVGSIECAELRQCVDQLIRRVASLDEVTEMDNKMNLIEKTLNNVSEAYEQV